MLVGWLIALGLDRRSLIRARQLRERERVESDEAMAKVRVQVGQLSGQANEFGEVFQFLPDHIRQLLLAQGPRAVAPLALALIERLLHPEQAAVFVARPTKKRLALAAGQGLPAHLATGAELPYGVGRLGYAAEAKVSLDETDFATARGEHQTKALDKVRALEDPGLRGLRVDAAAPILDGKELLGVLSIGGARVRRGHEKKLLALVSELASVAFTQATRLRAAEEAESQDGLTGVHNKRYLHERLQRELGIAARDGRPLSVLFLDIDHFEDYNRTNGHLAGDEVLRKLAQLLTGSVRDSDLVARVGGEEFVVVYVGADKQLAMRLADSLRQSIQAFPFPHRGHQPLGAVTVSGGVASFPEDSRQADALLRSADQALYEAKAAGRNRVFPGSPNFLT